MLKYIFSFCICYYNIFIKYLIIKCLLTTLIAFRNKKYINTTIKISLRISHSMSFYLWFGHTTSYTPHLVPNCEVKSGQAISSTALGDYAGTGCAERFSFFNQSTYYTCRYEVLSLFNLTQY